MNGVSTASHENQGTQGAEIVTGRCHRFSRGHTSYDLLLVWLPLN